MNPASITPFNLEPYQGKNRLLLIFASSASHPDYCMQLQMLAIEKANLTTRDIIIIKILSEGSSAVEGHVIDDQSVQQTRDRFGVNRHEFCVILVGKDGTEKRRERMPVQPKLLFTQIDEMPMRQREMQEQA